MWRLYIPLATLSILLSSGCGCGTQTTESASQPTNVRAVRSTPTEVTAAQRETEARKLAVRKARGAGAAETQNPVSGSHRDRESQEYGRKVVQHPAAGQERPEGLGEFPAASTIVDPPDGVSGSYTESTEEGRRLKEVGFGEFTISTYDKPVGEIVDHYRQQAGGRNRITEHEKKKNIVYAVKEGTLLVTVGRSEDANKSVVTRALISKNTGLRHIPTWVKDLERNKKLTR